ncbi:hypothetical protein AMTR_s00005p00197490 [Amborella trichopoda]|uniref:Uncharacterized protein n=1 Tax=Amborella trichopoda TaxID=13333 RepID=W1PGH3_AMBTC|nr:hypothetical protein AMTR_s00005p00197490 [Amborella trichopoda]
MRRGTRSELDGSTTTTLSMVATLTSVDDMVFAMVDEAPATIFRASGEGGGVVLIEEGADVDEVRGECTKSFLSLPIWRSHGQAAVVVKSWMQFTMLGALCNNLCRFATGEVRSVSEY